MIRRHSVPPASRPAPLAYAMLTLVLLCVLACSTGQMKPGFSPGEAGGGTIFNGGNKTRVPSQSATASAANEDSFFALPKGWSMVSADDESGVYKLKHDTVSAASIILSYDQLTATDGARLDELKSLHASVITKLPDSLTAMPLEVTSYKGEPRYHTMLRGRPSPDSPDMVVSGYTVALVQDAFTVFAAYPSEHNTLAADVETLIYSLKPYTPIAPEEPTSKEEPSSDAGSKSPSS